MPAAWKVKQLQEHAERMLREAGPKKPPNRRGRDAAFFGAGAATGAAGATIVNRRSKPVSKSLVELSKSISSKQRLAMQAGAVGTGVVVGEAGGRHVGRKRYAAGKHVNDGFFMGPSVNRGYFGAERKAKGKLYGSAKKGSHDLDDGRVTKAFSARDENSSVGTKITYVKPAHSTSTTKATGERAGRTRGVGRRQESRDAYSTPRVEHVRPRRLDGKYASSAKVIEVFKPNGSRKTSMNTLEVHGKKSKVGKAYAPSKQLIAAGRQAELHAFKTAKPARGKGLIQTSGDTKVFQSGGRVGRRI